jgi:hypothetical protein
LQVFFIFVAVQFWWRKDREHQQKQQGCQTMPPPLEKAAAGEVGVMSILLLEVGIKLLPLEVGVTSLSLVVGVGLLFLL